MAIQARTANPAHILVAATPAPGHVNPMLAIACDLRDRGHSIVVNTADVFREQVEADGLRFEPLKGAANLDYRTFLPESRDLKPGPEEMIYKINDAPFCISGRKSTYVEPTISPIGAAKAVLDIVGVPCFERVPPGKDRLGAVLGMNGVGNGAALQCI